jgi:hypothetical protein
VKVLLDEDLPHDLRLHIAHHEVQTAAYAGFAGAKNGKLMEALAAAGFEVFVTGDKNLPYQQPLLKMPFGTVVLSTQNLPVLVSCLPLLQSAIDTSAPGSISSVECIDMKK